jgi:hypothetical protein
MYTAMERETDPHTARREYEEAVEGFNQFLNAKNRGMYHELVGSPNNIYAYVIYIIDIYIYT